MFEKVKTHIKEHKFAYSCAATGIVVAGFTAIVMKGSCAILQSGMDGPAKVTTLPFSFNFLTRESGNIVTTVHNGNRGHPGFRVRNLDFLIERDTQGEMSRMFSISPAMLSSHLNGKVDNVNGLHFERIPVEGI
jgi:hypothetical protein